MMSANTRTFFGLQIVLVCLYSAPSHYHHCANLSEGIELMKCLSDIYFVECVSKIKHVLSVIHYTICGAVCFQFTHFSCGDWENICTLSYYHHQIGSVNYYPLFRVRSWNNGVRCMYFYIIIMQVLRLFCSTPHQYSRKSHYQYMIYKPIISWYFSYHNSVYCFMVSFAHKNIAIDTTALLQIHLHSRLNTRIQYTEQWQLQNETRNI